MGLPPSHSSADKGKHSVSDLDHDKAPQGGIQSPKSFRVQSSIKMISNVSSLVIPLIGILGLNGHISDANDKCMC